VRGKGDVARGEVGTVVGRHPRRVSAPARGADEVVVHVEAVEEVGGRCRVETVLLRSRYAVEVAGQAVAVDLDTGARGDRDAAVPIPSCPAAPIAMHLVAA